MGNMSITPAALAQWRQRKDAPLLFDVRRRPVFERSRSMIPGARWGDPFMIGVWAPQPRPEQDIVVYCVAGHEVSRGVRDLLHSLGHRAWYLTGGLEAWIERGGDLSPGPVVDQQPPLQAA